MTQERPADKPRRSILKRIGRGVLIFLLVIVALIGLSIVLIQTEYVQNIARKQGQKWLAGKLKTRVEIGYLYVGFPNEVTLKNIYIGDRQNDTLLSGGSLKVDIDMWKLLKNELRISQVELKNITAKVTRVLPDTAFNFQFIVDAFASDEKNPETVNDSTALSMSLDRLMLDSVRFVYNDVITGNDMEVFIGHNETVMKTLDPQKQIFNVALLKLDNVRGRVYQNNPLRLTPAVEKIRDSTTAPPQLIFRDIDLSSINLDYRNAVAGLFTDINVGRLKGQVEKFDLAGMSVTMNTLAMSGTNAAVRLGKKKAADPG
ncbi:MAG: hypothetical protein H7Y27_15580, partial [Gemmatimonadaceae bacterium]|nr:hypothetical protein [Chitinophagaceae bacterium]